MTQSPPEGGDVRRLDLTGRETHSQAAVIAIERVAAAFTRGARRSMPFLLRSRSKLVASEVEAVKKSLTLFGDERALSYTAFVAGSDATSWAAVSLDAGAIGLVLEGALGGSGGKPPELGPSLTSPQRALVSRIAGSLARDLAAALTEELRVPFSAEKGRSPASRGEPYPSALRCRCDIVGAIESATVTIAAGAEAVEAAARQLQAEQGVAGDPRIGDVMPEVPLEMIAELGRVVLGLRRVLSLQPGDVLRLKTAADDPVIVRVGGIEKFVGVPVTSRGQIAVEIKGRHGE